MELLIATTNRGKIKEIEKLLKEEFPGLKLYSLDDLGITAECPEDGLTFLENASAKSLFYSKLAGDMVTIADDSGLVVAALNGEPGVHSARYADEPTPPLRGTPPVEGNSKHFVFSTSKVLPEHSPLERGGPPKAGRGVSKFPQKNKDSRQLIDQRNIEKLLKKLNNEENRAAKFLCEIVLSKNGKIIESFHGEVEGVILREKKGSGGFGYDPVFYYQPLKKTFAQLTTAEKNKFSHRANALKKLKDYLKSGGSLPGARSPLILLSGVRGIPHL